MAAMNRAEAIERPQRFSSAATTQALSHAMLLLVVLHLWRPGLVIAQTDLFPVPDAFGFLKQTFLAWNNVGDYFGMAFPTPPLAPDLVVSAILQHFAGESLAQILSIWIILAATWQGTFVVGRIFGASVLTAATGAWLYVLSPIMQIHVGTFTALNWMAAALPWLSYTLLRASSEPSWRRVATLIFVAFAAALFPVVAFTIQIGYSLVVAMSVIAVLALIRSQDRGVFCKWFARTLGLMLLATLWWLPPLMLSYLTASITHTADLNSVSWVFARASLLNELRFNPVWTWRAEYFPFANAYDENILSYSAGFFPFVLLLLGSIVARGPVLTTIRIFGVSALFFLFLAKVVHPPAVWLNALLFHLPGFFLFQEPIGLIVSAAFFLSISATLAISQLELRPRWQPRAKYLSTFTLVLAAFGAWPLLSGLIFHDANDTFPSMYVKLSDDWPRLAGYLRRLPGTEGVLVLPRDTFYQVRYSWGYDGADMIPQLYLARRVLNPGVPIGYIANSTTLPIRDRIVSLFSNESPLTAQFLKNIQIRYVVFRNDVMIGGVFNINQRQVDASLPNTSKLRFGDLTLYDLGPIGRPEISAQDGWIGGNYGTAHPTKDAMNAADLVELSALTNPSPRIDLSEYRPSLTPPITREVALDADRHRDRSRTMVSKSPSRYVWNGQRSGTYRADGTAQASLAASFAGLAPFESAATYDTTTLSAKTPENATPLFSVVIDKLSQDEFDYNVISPAAAVLRADVAIAVRSPTEMGYALMTADQLRRVRDRRSPELHWIIFRDISLRAGPNDLVLLRNRKLAGPIVTTHAASQPQSAAESEAQIRVMRLDTRSSHRAVRPLPGLVIPMNVQALEDPHIALDSSAPPVVATLLARSDGIQYACPVTISSGDSVSLDFVLASCLGLSGILPELDVQSTSFDQLVLNKPDGGLSDIVAYRGKLTLSKRSVWHRSLQLEPRVIPSTGYGLSAAYKAAATSAAIYFDRVNSLNSSANSDIWRLWRLLRKDRPTVADVRLRVTAKASRFEGRALLVEPGQYSFARPPRVSLDLDTTTGPSLEQFEMQPTGGRTTAYVLPLNGLPLRLSGNTVVADIDVGYTIPSLQRTWRPCRISLLEEDNTLKISLGHKPFALLPKRGHLATMTLQRPARIDPIRLNADQRLSVLAIDIARSPVAKTVSAKEIYGSPWLQVIRIDNSRAAVLLNSQTFDASWLAIALDPSALLPPHVEVDGWRNGWFIRASRATVIVVNVLVLYQFIGVLASALVVGSSSWRLRHA